MANDFMWHLSAFGVDFHYTFNMRECRASALTLRQWCTGD
jgi:hypothetical protein